MDTGSGSRDQHYILRVQFKNELSFETHRDRRIFKMFVTFVFADICGFLWRPRHLIMFGGEDGH